MIGKTESSLNASVGFNVQLNSYREAMLRRDIRTDYFKMKTRPAIQDDYRVNAVFRKKGDQWVCIQYAEMAMAPLSYVEHLYRRGVADGFPENGQPYDAGRSGYDND